eukprot:4214049-Pyramimonas_sp.AAC.1
MALMNHRYHHLYAPSVPLEVYDGRKTGGWLSRETTRGSAIKHCGVRSEAIVHPPLQNRDSTSNYRAACDQVTYGISIA